MSLVEVEKRRAAAGEMPKRGHGLGCGSDRTSDTESVARDEHRRSRTAFELEQRPPWASVEWVEHGYRPKYKGRAEGRGGSTHALEVCDAEVTTR